MLLEEGEGKVKKHGNVCWKEGCHIKINLISSWINLVLPDIIANETLWESASLEKLCFWSYTSKPSTLAPGYCLPGSNVFVFHFHFLFIFSAYNHTEKAISFADLLLNLGFHHPFKVIKFHHPFKVIKLLKSLRSSRKVLNIKYFIIG